MIERQCNECRAGLTTVAGRNAGDTIASPLDTGPEKLLIYAGILLPGQGDRLDSAERSLPSAAVSAQTVSHNQQAGQGIAGQAKSRSILLPLSISLTLYHGQIPWRLF